MEHPYRKFALVIAVNAVVMYFVMYATIYSAEHFHFNINRLYMTCMMVAPMVILMLVFMRGMYPNKTANLAVAAISAAAFVICLLLVRTQTPIGDTQFLRAMIPHHSGAILMCKESNLTDMEIRDLCDQIIESQQREIAQMEKLLKQHQ